MCTISLVIVHLICINHFVLALPQKTNFAFPDGFVFGVGTSSYQVEGAWNESGKSENIWDYNLHKNPSLTVDQNNGDIACDSYHKYEEDIKLVENLGVDFYRFSISWTRILPKGLKNTQINPEGIAYYDKLINGLLDKNIQPYVTIFHWDLPQVLQEKGGWLNETIIDDYVYYSEVLFKLFGDRVKYWFTFNEFSQFCERGYSTGANAPFLKLQGVGGYRCYYNAIIAHAKTYRMYQEKFKAIQNGFVGITIDSSWCEPASDSESDREAAERFMQFYYGGYVHPITIGNYPEIMIERIGELSAMQGYEKSRLPAFSNEQIELVKGTFDILGLNHYSSYLCSSSDDFPQPSFQSDCGVLQTQDPKWKTSAAQWIKYAPWGLRKLLVWIKEQYSNPLIIITENGWANAGADLNDDDRIEYLTGYLNAVLEAINEDGCNVIGYSYWSLMDNLEWTFGYTKKFGLIEVDFNSSNRTRTPRKSYEIYKSIINQRRIND